MIVVFLQTKISFLVISICLKARPENYKRERFENRQAELLNEGMPDGAKLLGLTRDILPETLCIRQGDVLRVLSNAKELQEQLQRAAAAGGAGEPAEAAINRIRDFQREHVGLLRIGAAVIQQNDSSSHWDPAV